jgi:nitroimidazol reductase NimA-like FMN-containing flavoprotein (pyridoxamine 5'-phosphate oxidase superfamily)
MIYQLSAEEARTQLAAEAYGHLGCIVDDEPYVVPINYVFADGCLYVHSLPGRKVDGMRELPRVCLQVERIRSQYRWRSVQAFGEFEEITDDDERERAFDLLFARFPRLTPADSVRGRGRLGEPTIAFRIRIDRVVGVGEGEE